MSAAKEAKKDKKVHIKRVVVSALLKSNLIRSIKSNEEDAKIVGIDIIKEILTLLSRVNPRNIPPDMVFPDLDVPGIRASACHTPIIRASLYDQLR